MEKEKNINITYSCEETLKKMKEYMEKSSHVTLYTSSLNALTSHYSSIANVIVATLLTLSRKKDKKVSIVTDFYIDKDSFYDEDLNRTRELEYKGIPVRVVHKKSAVDKFFINLGKKLYPIKAKIEKRKSVPGHKLNVQELKNFYEMFDFAVSYYDESKDTIKDCLNTLKQDLIKDAQALISSEELDGGKFERSIEECFSELDKNLGELNSNNSKFVIKQVLMAVASIFDMVDPKSIIKKANGSFIFYETANLAYKLYKYNSNRALYGVSLPILSFFTSRFASIISTLNKNSNCNVLVFKKEERSSSGFFIDFTHMNLDYQFFADKNNLNELNCNADEGYSVYGYLDDIRVFEYSKNIRSNETINKNLGFGSGDDTLFKRIKDQIRGLNSNLNFICAANFNSVKLANLISDKSDKNGTSTNDEMNSKDFSNLNKNYIVLSNSPFRSSAGLREEVVSKSLDQEIKDELNRSNKSNLVKQKFTDIKTLEPVKDYSKYSIDINKDNQKSTLVLNLSPFARIDKSYIDNIEQKKGEFQSLTYNDDGEYLDQYGKYDELFRVNYAHVNAYAKQPNDMEEIKKNEEEYMKKVTLSFKSVFEKINESVYSRIDVKECIINNTEEIKDLELNEDTEGVIDLVKESIDNMPFKHYSLVEALSVAVAYFIVTKTYQTDMIKKSVKYDGEYIEIAEQTINVFHLRSAVKLGDKFLRLFFYKDSVESGLESGEYLCIEEIVEYLDGKQGGEISSIEDLLKENSHTENSAVDTSILDIEKQKYIEELLKSQAKEIETNWNKDNTTLKSALKLQDLPYSNARDLQKEATTMLVKTAIEGVLPLAEFVSEDGMSKVYEYMGTFIFGIDKKALREQFIDELGILNVVRRLFQAKDTKHMERALKFATNLRADTSILRQSRANIIKQAINSAKLHFIIGYYNLNIIWDQMKSFAHMKRTYEFDKKDVEAMRKLIKNYGKSLGKDLFFSAFKSLLELWKTSYEQLEENYNEIMHTRYTYKFNEAYALNNISYKPLSIDEAFDKNSTASYCYYPVMIYQNYISLNLNRLFLGANISSGGLDYNSFIYYDIDHKKNKLSFNLASKLALNNLSAYLCLDELRGAGNEIDANYFKYARSRYANSDVYIRGLDTDVKEEKEIYDIYNKDDNQDGRSFSSAIKSYQKATEIINNFKDGKFNTDDENSHSNLSRDLVEALDTIGNNNIKGIYVGCKVDLKDRAKENIPPRLVGRLATTIVMEDGLYIG